MILAEQVSWLWRLSDEAWDILKRRILVKGLSVLSLNLPTSHIALTNAGSDEFTQGMIRAVNGMMLDMLAAIARKDCKDRGRRQREGVDKARLDGKYAGRQPDVVKHLLIKT